MSFITREPGGNPRGGIAAADVHHNHFEMRELLLAV